MKISKTGTAVISTLLVGLVLGIAVLWLTGFRFFVVASPSMGTTAPVGTLVIAHPSDSYDPGDIVTYSRDDRTYTHRVIGTNSDGLLITQGDLNKHPDAAPVSPNNVVGEAVFVGKHLGWVYRALPLLIIGGLLVYLISCGRRWRDLWRWHIRIIGWPVVITIVTFIINPWMHAEMLTYMPRDKGVDMHLVNTGVFTLRLDENTRIASGEDAIVHVTEKDELGRFLFMPEASIGWGGVALAMLWCLWPMLLGLLMKFPAELDDDQLAEEEEHPERHRRAAVMSLAIALVAAVIAFTMLKTYAAYSASVQNAPNTVGTRTYFTCAAAQGPNSAPRPLFAYALNSTGTEPDIARGAQPGTWNAQAALTSSGSRGCLRDSPVAATFNGTSACLINPTVQSPTPQNFTVEAWFNTTVKSGGKIIGYSNSVTRAGETRQDRHLYIDKSGRIMYGLYPGTLRVLASANRNYADGAWHHVVATTSPAGSYLYVDGVMHSFNTTFTSAEAGYNGYWKIGCGNISNWPNADGTRNSTTRGTATTPEYFTGQIQYAAVYGQALTAAQVREHYLAGAP